MSAPDLPDPLPLARALIQRASVTGALSEGVDAQAVLADALAALGFTVETLPFGPAARRTPNLFATVGHGRPHVCFAGHTDVVPPGDRGWSVDPFAARVEGDRLIGRGACDMKGAIAAFVAAAAGWLADGPPPFTVSVLATGDEEGDATDGTVRVVEWLARLNRLPDFCLVGEPTNAGTLGETVRIGRRGSLHAEIAVDGVQGHVAYPERADNPVHRLLAILGELVATPLDEGTPFFEPSGLQVTSIDVGNQASNVIPARAASRLNIRFNDRHDGASLGRLIRDTARRHAPDRATVDIRVGAAPFVTEPAGEIAALADAIESVTGLRPVLDTGGGTSDARFFAPYCRVAEFGLVGRTMHAVDEHVPLADLRALAAIYHRFLVALAPDAGAMS